MKKIVEIVKKNKIKTLIFSGLGLLAIAGVSFAFFLVTTGGSQRSITFSNVSVTYAEGGNINVSNNLPMSEADALNYGARKNFAVTNNGNVTEYINLSLTSISISNSLKNSNFRYMLYESNSSYSTLGTKISSGDFSSITDNSVEIAQDLEYSASTTKYYSIIFYIYDDGSNQTSMLNATFNAKVTATASDKPKNYKDSSGANSPELVEGLIPVIYNEDTDNWKVANPAKKWYDYDTQMWANAVTVNDSSLRDYTSHIGEDIPMTSIDTMWVWIPRYKYKITSNIGSGSNVTNPPQIDVVFESGTSTTGTAISSCSITATNCYYTHPAFRNGASVYKSTAYDLGGWSSELSGFWVGKFETGVATNSTCGNSPSSTNCTYANVYNTSTGAKPLIKPDVISLNYQNVSTEFQTSLVFAGGTMDTSTGVVTYGTNQYGITRNSTTDSHMVKNTEWGAVAYLSQSKYGKNGNSNYSGTNKEIYKNNSYASYKTYTGRSSGVLPASGYSQYGTYGYNDKGSCGATCTGTKTANTGTGASTTGTIYGIYDMSGGLFEYTMSNWAGTVGSSGFNSAVLTSTTSTVKRYYDKYTGTSSTTASSATSIKGDATYETEWWYSDNASFVNASYPWARRGGYYDSIAVAGVFYFDYSSSVASSYVGFRSALIP